MALALDLGLGLRVDVLKLRILVESSKVCNFSYERCQAKASSGLYFDWFQVLANLAFLTCNRKQVCRV